MTGVWNWNKDSAEFRKKFGDIIVGIPPGEGEAEKFQAAVRSVTKLAGLTLQQPPEPV